MKELLLKCALEMEQNLTRFQELQMILETEISNEEYDRLMEDPEVQEVAERVESLIEELI